MGKNQSPVNLTAALDAPLPDLQLQYGATMNEVVNNGHTIQVNSQPGSVMALEGKEYALKQVHFHTPSENHIEGRSFPMEAHFVHADAQGNLVVVGVMFAPGLDDNPALAAYWRHMPTAQGGHSALKTPQNAGDLLPASRAAYYRFNGSLTTPPCSEGVKWVVLKSPVKASEAQIDRFRKVIGENNRPIQPLNARVIVD